MPEPHILILHIFSAFVKYLSNTFKPSIHIFFHMAAIRTYTLL